MDLTTGAILRRITRTDLSVSAHKLATLILDGIAWKDGYNGLPLGTAAFALSDLATRMGVSRQHLHALLNELASSGLRLLRHRGRGRFTPWLFRFACCDEPEPGDVMSTTDDISPYKEDSHKNVFSGMIVLDRSAGSQCDRWLALIGRAKATLPCRTADSRHIWDRFREFNHRRGHGAVPAGYLLGFMRKWRGAVAPCSVPTGESRPAVSRQQVELQSLIANAPFVNRHFHERDLKRAIGENMYFVRLAELQAWFNCSGLQARLALHGSAVAEGKIAR